MAQPKHKRSRQPGPAGAAVREQAAVDAEVQRTTLFQRGSTVRLIAAPENVGRVVAVRLATDELGGQVVLYVAVFGTAQRTVAWPVLENELELAPEQKNALVIPGAQDVRRFTGRG